MAKIVVLPIGRGSNWAADYILNKGVERVYFAVPPGRRVFTYCEVDCVHVGGNIYRATRWVPSMWRRIG